MPFRDTMHEHNLGRGRQATTDMKARIAALRDAGCGDELVPILWDRMRRAEVDGEGYEYEYAGETPDPFRPAG